MTIFNHLGKPVIGAAALQPDLTYDKITAWVNFHNANIEANNRAHIVMLLEDIWKREWSAAQIAREVV